MEYITDSPILTDELQDEKMSSRNHSDLQTRLGFLLMLAYRQQYSIYTELDFDFASGKTRPDLCILPKHQANWMEDEIIVSDIPLTTIEILSPEQSMNSLLDRIYKKHFPAGALYLPPLSSHFSSQSYPHQRNRRHSD